MHNELALQFYHVHTRTSKECLCDLPTVLNLRSFSFQPVHSRSQSQTVPKWTTGHDCITNLICGRLMRI